MLVLHDLVAYDVAECVIFLNERVCGVVRVLSRISLDGEHFLLFDLLALLRLHFDVFGLCHFCFVNVFLINLSLFIIK